MKKKAFVFSSTGLLRIVLATIVAFLLVETQSHLALADAYLAIGIALVFGALLAIQWPRFFSRESLGGLFVDSLAISLMVGSTGGETSLFFPLYLLAALGVSRTPNIVRSIVGSAALVGGYLVAAVASVESPGMLLSPAAGFEAGLIALFCALAAAMGAKLRNAREQSHRTLSTFARERQYEEQIEALFLDVGPVLEILSPEGIMRWVAQAARKSLGAPYAHAATLDGRLHQTSAERDRDVYPSWWHPEIQRLLLWSCRTGEVVHSGTSVHGMEGFVAVPLASQGAESVGAIVLGGKSFSIEEERALKLLADQVAPALRRVNEAPGGRDPVSGAPNRDSLHRVLRRELASAKPLTVFVVDLDRFSHHGQAYGLAAEDFLLRQMTQKLQEIHQYVFRYTEDAFVVVSSDASRKRAAAAAQKIQRAVEELTANSVFPLTVSVGFAIAKTEHRDSRLLLDAALEALARAKGQPDRIDGLTVDAGDRSLQNLTRAGEGRRIAVKALAEAIEIRDPSLGEHSRAVSRLASLIGLKMPLPQEQIDTLSTGALLHDIGKIGIADNILHKPTFLNAEEYELIKQHPLLGARILGSIAELSDIIPAVKHHHERFDGKGYPDGLRGEYIPLIARIINVADALDTITRNRPYRRGHSEEYALHEIVRNSGTQFDPEAVRALREVIKEAGGQQLSS